MAVRLIALIAALAVVGCDQQSDFITETAPFVEAAVPTPIDGKNGIASRAKQFADQHRMKMHYVPDHFESREFTVSLTRGDLNIIAGNVAVGGQTNVTAYSRAATTPAQRAEVDAYLCQVMKHRCVE